MKFFTEIKNNTILDRNMKDGSYELEVVKKRNCKLLAKYWKLLQFACYHMPEGMKYTIDLSNCTKEAFHEILKNVEGKESVSFGKMSEDEFRQHYSRTLDLICGLLSVEKEDVINELVSYM